MNKPVSKRGRAILAGYGMLGVLLLLCVFFSVVTLTEQHPTGASAAGLLAKQLSAQLAPGARVMIAVRPLPEDEVMAATLETSLKDAGFVVAAVVKGEPKDARDAMQRLAAEGVKLDAIACTQTTGAWLVFTDVRADFPSLGEPLIAVPQSYKWPNFLKRENLLNIANQIAVIAIIAIGMTMVIITGGIDLSVGSLIAFSAVLSCLLIRDMAGGVDAGMPGMLMGGVSAVLGCGLIGVLTGAAVTLFGMPPFIVTLAVMLAASGLAYLLAEGQSVYQLPETFTWLGRDSDFFNLPNAVLLMLLLYVAAHVLMTRMKLGRWLYAVGGNREAARFSGVPVRRVLLFAYAMSGLLAGLGGVVMASQLKSGSPTYGQMYELYVIAAVVVGGASLSGGRGTMFGTLVGAFIIAVIQNGMNLKGVEPYTQKVVLGVVIYLAVLLDRMQQSNWSFRAMTSQ